MCAHGLDAVVALQRRRERPRGRPGRDDGRSQQPGGAQVDFRQRAVRRAEARGGLLQRRDRREGQGRRAQDGPAQVPPGHEQAARLEAARLAATRLAAVRAELKQEGL